jgi:hypothetical protein
MLRLSRLLDRSSRPATRRITRVLWPTLPAERVLTPHGVLVVSAALSFLVWVSPWSRHVRRGFSQQVPFDLGGVLLLLAWYQVIFVTALVGYRLGRRTPRIPLLDRFPDEAYYRAISVISAAGVTASYAIALHRLGAERFWRALEHRHFNAVRFAIDFHAGVQTLRYAAILGGGIALARIVLRRRVEILGVVNLVLLLAAAAIASRLSLVLALVLAVALIVRARPGWLLSPGRVVVLATVLFLALTPLNYIRNANYYEHRYHTSNPFLMNAYEAISYLGGPFQVSLGVANHAVATRRGSGEDLISRSVLQNSSFETGSFRDWAVTVSNPRGGNARIADGPSAAGWAQEVRRGPDFVRVDTEIARTGRHGVEARALGAAGAYSHLIYRTYFPAGRRYVVAGSFKRLGPVGETQATFRLICYDRQRHPIGSLAPEVRVRGMSPAGGAFVPTASWTRFGGGFSTTFPAGTAFVRIQVYPYLEAKGAAGVLLDDVRFGPAAHRDVSRGLAHVLAPTYLSPAAPDFRLEKESYRDYVDIQKELTTNSVFADLYGPLGLFAFPLIALVSFVAAAFVGHAVRYASFFCLAGYVVVYAFAELWRTYLFNAGIVHFLILVLALLPVLGLAAETLRRRLRPEHRAD